MGTNIILNYTLILFLVLLVLSVLLMMALKVENIIIYLWAAVSLAIFIYIIRSTVKHYHEREIQ